MQSPDMRHPTLQLARGLLLGALLLVAGAAEASGQIDVGNSVKKRGGDGVGGIEKTGNRTAGPMPPTGPNGGPGGSGVSFASGNGPDYGWSDLGGALTGAGTPSLQGSGNGAPGTVLALDLLDAQPWSIATLVLGTEAAPMAFKGGTLVPAPMILLGGLVTDDGGALHMEVTLPPDMPSGLTLCVQLWLVDPRGPQGLSASNGLQLLAP